MPLIQKTYLESYAPLRSLELLILKLYCYTRWKNKGHVSRVLLTLVHYHADVAGSGLGGAYTRSQTKTLRGPCLML